MRLSRRFLIAAGITSPAGAWAEANAAGQPGAPAAPAAGMLVPETGPDAMIGDECLRGVELAVADINQAGGVAGKPLSLLTQDASSEAAAGGAATALLNAHAAFLLGGGTSAIAYPASAAAELAQSPYIELNATADGVTGRGFKFLLRACQTTSMVAAVAIEAVVARANGRKIAMLFNTGATSGAIAAAAAALLKAKNITPALLIGYPEAVADLREPVERLGRAGAEILLHAGAPDDVLLLFQAMQTTGWRPGAIFGCGDGYGMRETAYALGAAFDGVYQIGAPCYPPRAGYIAAAYEARFGMAPRAANSLTAYVGAKLVFDILNQGAGDAGKLLDLLRAADIPAGTLANGFGVAFDKTGQNTRSFAVLQQWQGQSLTAVTG